MRLTAGDSVLLVAPHPDDETLAAGGLLQRALGVGARVRVVFATDGENNVWVQRLVERRFTVDDAARARFGAQRRTEAVAALGVLGVRPADVAFLGLPDCGLTDALLAGGEREVAAFAGALASFAPTVLVVPSLADVHPDHSALAVLVRRALDRAALARPPGTLEYVVHRPRGARAAPSDVELGLTAAERSRKERAILSHATPMAVHRADFLARVREPERFSIPAAPGVEMQAHPLRRAAIDGPSMRFDIVLRSRVGAFGAATLHVVGREKDGGKGAIRVALPSGPRVRVAVPRESLPSGSTFFAKIERKRGFFDEAGWIEIPASGTRPPPPSAGQAAVVRPPPRVCAIVPCYQVAATCGDVVRGAARVADRVIAVDDGSRDETAEALRAAASTEGGRVEVLTFPENRGKGVALIEAIRAALARGPSDLIVTLDSDGQHRPEDTPALVTAWRGGADLVIGARQQVERMPLRSRLGNTLTGILLQRFFPRCPADTQSGFRALDRAFAEMFVANVVGMRYETEMQMLLLALSRGLRVESVPIPTVYLEGNRSSHFRPLVDSARIYRALWTWRRGSGGRRAAPRPVAERAP